MIVNLYISLIFVLIVKKVYNTSILKESHICLGFFVLLFLKGIVTTFLFIQQTNHDMNLECELFQKEFKHYSIPKWNLTTEKLKEIPITIQYQNNCTN